MNMNPELASTWKGRLFMKISTVKTNVQRTLVESVMHDNNFSTDSNSQFQRSIKEKTKYDIVFDVGQAICLPSLNAKYTV